MFNPYDEFPHAISKGRIEVIGDFKFKKSATRAKNYKGFMDTPTTSEQLKYHQMSSEYDRNLYVPYDLPINDNDYFKYEGKIFGIVGEPVDQGDNMRLS